MPLELQDPRFDKLARSYEIENIPFYPQVEDQCGPSSLATMLGAQGLHVSPTELRGKLYIPDKQGTVTTEMIARARRFGFLVYPLEPELIELLTEINAGNPVLLMQNMGLDWWPVWHFSVAIGYDLDQQSISLRSGDSDTAIIDISLFQKTWQRANSWAIVIVPPEKLPRTAGAVGLIKAANQLEQVGEFDTALRVYKAVLSKWPETNIAHFGAGNSAFALAYYERAERYFSNYLKLYPDSSIAWNNLSYSLAELGCTSEAKQAIACALKIAPKDQNIQDSKAEIFQYPDRPTAAVCRFIDC